MLNVFTTLEIECPINVALTVMPNSDSDNSCQLAVILLVVLQLMRLHLAMDKNCGIRQSHYTTAVPIKNFHNAIP